MYFCKSVNPPISLSSRKIWGTVLAVGTASNRSSLVYPSPIFFSSNSIFFEGQSLSDSVSLTLPNATTLNVGRQFLFINESNVPVRIFKNSNIYFT